MKSKAKTARKRLQSIATFRPIAGVTLAVYLVTLLLCQLFTFENFPGFLSSLGIDRQLAKVVAIALVMLELLALPALISLKVPRSYTFLSYVAGGLGLALLSGLEIIAYSQGFSVLGRPTLDLPSGAWSLVFVCALWVLFIGVSDALSRLARALPR